MSQNEPSFGDLPEELAALPANDPKVKAYFVKLAQQALTTQGQQYEARLADAVKPVTQPAPTPKPTNADFWADPNAAVTRVAPTREEFASMNTLMQRTAIQNARMITQQKFVKDWSKFERKVLAIMSACAPEVQADSSNWDTAYYAVKGQETDSLVDEAVRTTQARMNSETSTPPDIPPPAPVALTGDQKAIINMLGITEDSYRKNQGRVTQWAPKQ